MVSIVLSITSLAISVLVFVYEFSHRTKERKSRKKRVEEEIIEAARQRKLDEVRLEFMKRDEESNGKQHGIFSVKRTRSDKK